MANNYTQLIITLEVCLKAALNSFRTTSGYNIRNPSLLLRPFREISNSPLTIEETVDFELPFLTRIPVYRKLRHPLAEYGQWFDSDSDSPPTQHLRHGFDGGNSH